MNSVTQAGGRVVVQVSGARGPVGADKRLFASGLITIAGTQATIAAAINVASVTQTATGRWRVVFATPLPSVKFGVNVTAMTGGVSASIDQHAGSGLATDHVDFEFTAGGNDADPTSFSFEVFDPSVLSNGYRGVGLARDMSNLKPVNVKFVDAPVDNAPTGNSPITKTWMGLAAKDTTDDQRVFMMSLGLVSTGGGGGDSTYQWDKLPLYVGMVCGDGTTNKVRNAWGANILLELKAKTDGLKYNFCNIVELDVNNNSGQEFGSILGDLGTDGACHGISVIGAGSNTITSGFIVINARQDIANNHLVQHSFVSGPGAAAQSDFYSVSNAAVAGLWERGYHQWGAYFAGGYSKGVMCIPNDQSIKSLTAVPTTGPFAGNPFAVHEVRLMTFDDNSVIRLGETQYCDSIQSEVSILPYITNQGTLGDANHLWSAVWANNGTIQRSDPTLKTNIRKLDEFDCEAAIEQIDPIVFNWIEGGQQLVEKDVTKEVDDTKVVDMTQTAVMVVDGKAVQVTQTVPTEQRQFDELPVFDEAGEPVMETVTEAATDADGKPIVERTIGEDGTVIERAVKHQVERQKTHLIPRRVTKTVKEMMPEAVPGKREHYGFDASQCRTIAQIVGTEDFGGYVKDEAGIENTRPDQFIPILWVAAKRSGRRIKELETTVADLTTRLAALEAKAG